MIERTFIKQGMKKIQLEQYLKKHLDKAGFTGLNMVKTPLVTRIVLKVARPGLAIGKGGQNIRMLTEDIEKNFGIDNPQIEIQDIQNPALDSKATVDKVVELIERGFSWKSVVFRTVREINEAGAQGLELVLKGKLSGKGGRKRKHRIVNGYMKKVGNQVKLVDTAKASAYPKAGAIGIKLSIIGPDVIFPDKVSISDAIKEKEVETEAKAVEEAKEENQPKKEEQQAKENKAQEDAKEKTGKKQEEPKEKTGKEENKPKKEEEKTTKGSKGKKESEKKGKKETTKKEDVKKKDDNKKEEKK